MNKSDLVETISEVADLSRASASKIMDAIIEGITTALKNNEQVSLLGFGTFCVKERAERKGRHPQTGAEITIQAMRIPSFKAGKGLKDALQEKDKALT